MRRPSPRSVAVAAAAATLALLPFTGASAAFDDRDYDLSTDCGIDATLQVRGNGNGISVLGDDTLAVGKERVEGEVVGAFVIDFGDDATADDNTVYTVRPADDDGLSCTFAVVSDDEVAELLGIDDLEAEDEGAADDDESDSEGSAGAEDEGEGAEKVVLCHKPEGGNPRVIEPSIDALQGHLDHGDYEMDDPSGDCPEATSAEGEEAGDSDAQQGNETAQEKRAERDAAKAERDAAKAERKNGQDPSQD